MKFLGHKFNFFGKDDVNIIDTEKTWFYMLSNGNSIDIKLFGEIGGMGIDAQTFIDTIESLGANKPLNIFIHSPGGEVFEGNALCNYILQYPMPTTAKVMGIAASMASLVAMSCQNIEMGTNAWIMIHNASGQTFGDKRQHQRNAKLLTQIDGLAVDAYLTRFSNCNKEQIEKYMDDETWFTYQDCIDNGLNVKSLGEVTPFIDKKMKIKGKFKNAPMDVINRFDVNGRSQIDIMNEEIQRLRKQNELLISGKANIKEMQEDLAKVCVTSSVNNNSKPLDFNGMIKVKMSEKKIDFKAAYMETKNEYPELFKASIVSR